MASIKAHQRYALNKYLLKNRKVLELLSMSEVAQKSTEYLGILINENIIRGAKKYAQGDLDWISSRVNNSKEGVKHIKNQILAAAILEIADAIELELSGEKDIRRITTHDSFKPEIVSQKNMI